MIARYRLRAWVVFDDGSTEPNPFMDWPYKTKWFGIRAKNKLNRRLSINDRHTRYYLWDLQENREVGEEV